MPRSGMTRILWIAAALSCLAVPGTHADAPVRRADAYKLVQIAEDSCAGALHALQAPGLGGSRSEPLRSALQRMGKSLAEIQARLDQADVRFFDMLGAGSRTLAEVSVVWPRTGLSDPAVDREIRSLSAAYGRLRNRYGAEWLRFQAGQALSADELRRFQALQAMQAAFAARLAVLIDKARLAGDAATARDLGLLMSQANAIAQAPPTLDEMLNAEVVADAIQGEYNAVRDANPDGDDAEWDDADQVAEDLLTDPSVGFVFTADLRSGTKWTYTRVETDVPADVADADIRSGALDEALAAGHSAAPAVLLEASGPEETIATDVETASGIEGVVEGVEGVQDSAAAVDDAEAMEGAETVEESILPLPNAVASGETAEQGPAAAKEPVTAAVQEPAVPGAVPPLAASPKLTPPPLQTLQTLRCFLL